MSARPLPASPALGTAGFGAGLAIGLAAVVGYAVGGPLAVGAVGVATGGVILALLYGSERVLIGAILLNLPLQLDVHLAYRTEEATLGALGGIPVSVTTVCLLLLMVRSAVVPTPGGVLAAARVPRPWVPLALFVGLSALSAVFASDRALAVYGLLVLVQSFVLFVYLSAALRRAEDVRWAVDLLLVGILIEAVLMALQRLGLRVPGLLASDVLQGAVEDEVVSRLSGTLGSPNSAASYLSVVLVIALAVVLSRPAARRMSLAAAALVTGGVGLALTVSRGGTLAFAVGAVALLGLAGRRRILRAAPLLVAAVAAALLAAAFGDEMLSRFVDDAGAAESRVPLMAIALRMIASAPLLGVGINNFVTALPDFVTPEFSQEWLYVVHNYYLQIASEAGLLTLVAFAAFLIVVIRNGWAASKTLPDDLALLALGVVGAVLARVVHMNFDLAGGLLQWESLLILAALAVALYRQSALRRPLTTSQRVPAALPEPTGDIATSGADEPDESAVEVEVPGGIRLDDRYELGALLGEGRAARVYRATDLLVGRDVAIKQPRGLAGTAWRRRVLRAARSARWVQHPNLIAIRDVQVGQSTFLVLDVVEGRQLSGPLSEGLSVQRAHVIADGLLSALEALHRGGVIHREVTASNVLVDSSGTAVLTSVGLAEAASEPGLGRGRTPSRRDRPAPSPEQREGLAADERSDVYAAGLLLQELLRWPPPPVRAVIERATAEDPADRYPNAGALRAAFLQAMARPPTAAAPPTTADVVVQRPRRAGRTWAIIALLAAVAIAAIGVLALPTEQTVPELQSVAPEQSAIAALVSGSDPAALGPTGTEILDRLRALDGLRGEQRAAEVASLYGTTAVEASRGAVDRAFADAVIGLLRPELTQEALMALIAVDPQAAGVRGPTFMGALRDTSQAAERTALGVVAAEWTQQGLLPASVGATAVAVLSETSVSVTDPSEGTLIVTAVAEFTDSGLDVEPGALVRVVASDPEPALRARMGDGEPFLVGSDATFPVAEAGRLLLGVDGDRGPVEVRYTISSPEQAPDGT